MLHDSVDGDSEAGVGGKGFQLFGAVEGALKGSEKAHQH